MSCCCDQKPFPLDGGRVGMGVYRSRFGFRFVGASSVMKAKAFRANARVTFFACAKKVTKESTPQAARPALRSGSASGPGIFVRHIHVPYENAVIHDGALRVLPGPLAVPHGDPEKQEQQQIADAFAFASGAP